MKSNTGKRPGKTSSSPTAAPNLCLYIRSTDAICWGKSTKPGHTWAGERSRLCCWRAKSIPHRSSGLSKWCRWPCCYGNIANWQQTWRGLRYLQGHSRGRSTGLFGEGSRHRAQLPQHRKGMWEREQAERERESAEWWRWPEGWNQERGEKERCGREKNWGSKSKRERTLGRNWKQQCDATYWEEMTRDREQTWINW